MTKPDHIISGDFLQVTKIGPYNIKIHGMTVLLWKAAFRKHQPFDQVKEISPSFLIPRI